jgi:hypothetical protein
MNKEFKKEEKKEPTNAFCTCGDEVCKYASIGETKIFCGVFSASIDVTYQEVCGYPSRREMVKKRKKEA